MVMAALRRRSRRGVTFVELMIVLLIMVLLTGISVPSMMGVYRRGQISAAAREFAALARLGRQRAVLAGAHTLLEIDPEQGTYRLNLAPEDPKRRVRVREREKTDRMERTRAIGDGSSRVRILSAESALSEPGRADTVKIYFYRNGTATPATVVLTDNAKRLMTVQVIGATGDVRVGSGPPEALVVPVVTPLATEAPPPSAAAPAPTPSPAPGHAVRIKNRGEPAQMR